MLCSFIPVAEESTPECFELALSRSGDRPIEVTFDGTRAIVASLKVLNKHVSRISSFQIQRVPYGRAQDISRMILMVLPRLHTLDLWFEPAREAEVVMLSFPHDCLPRLRELSLCGAGLQPDPCAQGAAMKLTRLELRDSIDPGCNILEFLHFLQMCRDLEDLTLVRFRPSEDGFDVTVDRRDLETLPVVTLTPRLQRFVLEDLDAFTARLLSGLSVPLSTDFVVIKLISPHDPAEIRDVIPLSSDPISTSLPQNTPGIPSLKAVIGLRLVWRPFASVCLVADTGESAFSLGLKTGPGRTAVLYPKISKDFEILFGDAPVEYLCVEDDAGAFGFHTRDWEAMLGPCAFPDLRKLSLFTLRDTSYEYGSPKQLIQASALHSGCLELEELEIGVRFPSPAEDDVRLIEDLCALLRSRASHKMPLRRLLVELNDGPYPPLGEEERSVREALYVDALEPLVDVVECAHGMLAERPLQAKVCQLESLIQIPQVLP
ncbi:hypothetical protein OH76DRAFT_1559672 [Lentinus brumalis]|uniref:F-box domain-containing protein n=1 Tax=Lentinus brumalis TaxID=2498619 RepID=A0A371CW23_9APHY|nr:hypothetical protein OH76DRAFT_1559672 [Polyporus brumalis]